MARDIKDKKPFQMQCIKMQLEWLFQGYSGLLNLQLSKTKNNPNWKLQCNNV